VCQGYLAPAKIDPRLLDPKHVFSEVDTVASQRVNLLDPAAKVRRREGYEEGNVALHKTCSVSAFIASDHYLDLLSETNSFEWGPDDVGFKKHRATTPEVVELMKDLKVLGKTDFKQLIKWRGDIRAWLAKQAKVEEGDADSDEDEGNAVDPDAESVDEADAEINEQDELEAAVEESKAAALRENKRIRRKKDKDKIKARERQALQMDMPLDIDDVIQDSTLFAMKTITSQAGLGAVDEAEWTGDEDDAGVALPAGAREELDKVTLAHSRNARCPVVSVVYFRVCNHDTCRMAVAVGHATTLYNFSHHSLVCVAPRTQPLPNPNTHTHTHTHTHRMSMPIRLRPTLMHSMTSTASARG
jgi:AdoMet-dependent rRNA methyltransferase SPB1